MSWTLSEFLLELEQDTSRRVLFVEGLRDISFWKAVVPPSERKDTVVYTIGEIEIEASVLGGERGRLKHFAEQILPTTVAPRVLFFADDDCSSLVGACVPSNVVLTDGRDVEAYALTPSTFERLCVTGLAKSEAFACDLFECVVRIGRAAGLVRVTSDSEEWDLPFQKTTKNGYARFIVDTHSQEGGSRWSLISLSLKSLVPRRFAIGRPGRASSLVLKGPAIGTWWYVQATLAKAFCQP